MEKIQTEEQVTTNLETAGVDHSVLEHVDWNLQGNTPAGTSMKTDPLYPSLRKARVAFTMKSLGELDLLSAVYKGDGERHQVFHHSCGHHSLISLHELEALPHAQWCPHCHGTDDLGRFGSIEHLQVSVYRESGHTAYFFASNPLGAAEQEYAFWCVRHCHSYRATYSEFQATKGRTNGCPLCAKTTGRLAD